MKADAATRAAARLRYQREVAIAQSSKLEAHPNVVDGWAVYEGCNGEDPRLVAFVLHEKLALQLCSLTCIEEDGVAEHVVFDGTWVPAQLTPSGIVASNDINIKDSASLKAAIKKAWEDEGSRQLVVGCIGKRLQCGCRKCTGGPKR